MAAATDIGKRHISLTMPPHRPLSSLCDVT